MAALGPDESSRVELVSRDYDVFKINVESLRQDWELVQVRKKLEFPEIRARLQDAEVEFETSAKKFSERLVLISGNAASVFQTSSAGVRGDLSVKDTMSLGKSLTQFGSEGSIQ